MNDEYYRKTWAIVITLFVIMMLVLSSGCGSIDRLLKVGDYYIEAKVEEGVKGIEKAEKELEQEVHRFEDKIDRKIKTLERKVKEEDEKICKLIISKGEDKKAIQECNR